MFGSPPDETIFAFKSLMVILPNPNAQCKQAAKTQHFPIFQEISGRYFGHFYRPDR
jgi:hypothetical protein